jgi:glycosidase
MKQSFMKRIIVFVLLITVVLFTYGCDGKTKPSSDGVKNQTTAAPDGATITPTAAPAETEDTTAAWAQDAVFYEIFVRSFADGNGDGIGDFKGIADKVEYLKELGIDAVWLMPMMESTTYHGYDVVDYRSVEQDYGTMEDFKAMLDTLHENGIKVIIDFVVNHTSYKNAWFTEALKDENSKYRDYYLIQDQLPENPEGWRKDPTTSLYYYGQYDSIMPDLNYNNQAVKDEIKDIAGYWLDQGVDGFRLDGSKNIDPDMNITHDWWKEFTEYVIAKNPSAFIVGENWYSNMDSLMPFYADMNSSFNFPLCTEIANIANGAGIDVVTELNKAHEKFKEASEGEGSANSIVIDSTMIGNHDMDRIATIMGNADQTKLAASLQFTLPGTPFIYYGDELGQLGQKPDDCRREPLDWYASAQGEGMTVMDQSFFNKSKYTIANDGISYEEESADANSVLNHYKKLIAIRKANKALFTGTYELAGMGDGLYAYTVSDQETGEKLLIVHNLAESSQTITLNVAGTDLYNDAAVEAGSFELKGYSTLIFKYESEDAPMDTSGLSQESQSDYTITFKVTLPENTPMEDSIYLVGTFNEWDPGNTAYIMTRTSATTCEIQLSGMPNTAIQYKFTRGDWNHREQNSTHQDLVGPLQAENRVYEFTVPDDVVECTIESWSDIK